MSVILLGLQEHEVTSEERDAIAALALDDTLVVTSDRARMQEVLDDTSVIAGPVPIELVLGAPGLRWFQQWGAGVDWMLEHPEIVERDLVITNVSGIHAIPISEHIIALLLGFARGLPASVRAQQHNHWRTHKEIEVFELAGKTMLVLGMGEIGTRTARLAAALEMRVIGTRRTRHDEVPGVERLVGPEQFHEVLPEADVVVITLPLTRETRGLIGQKELALMKPSAFLVNIGRGPIIDEPALIRALQEDKIAGAGLDVFASEPLPADSPLWAMPNVLITAHYAGLTPRYHERAMAIFLDNLKLFVTGQPLHHLVDKQAGY